LGEFESLANRFEPEIQAGHLCLSVPGSVN
jgi:hypothetical protein